MTAQRKRIEKVCPVCGVSFRPWTFAQKSCSPKCQGAAQVSGPNATCAKCGQSFHRYPSGNRRYCSSRCGWDARVDRAWVAVRCLNCDGEFRRRSQPSWSKVNRVFCSRLCAQNYTAGENHPAWRGGREPYFGKAWGRLAETIRERDGRCCRRCGKSELDNGRRLPVDHIVPRRLFDDITEANQPSNLATLCDRCHGWKTMVAERRYLAGDVIDFLAYQQSLDLSAVLA